MHSQTKANAPRKRARRAIRAARARMAVARSPYPIIVRKFIGTPASTAPGAMMVPPTMRNAWTHSNGARAFARESLEMTGATFHMARSAKAIALKAN